MKLYALLSAAVLASQACLSAALTDNLVAYWDFEGNANNHASASGGSAYHGTLTGGATTAGTPRVGSGALGLDGVNDYMDVTSIVNSNQAWSVAAWYRPSSSPSGTNRYFVFETSGASVMSFGLREGISTSDTAHQLYTDQAGTSSDPNQSVQVADTSTTNTWHHILVVFTPSTVSTPGAVVGYLDGVAQYNLVIPAGQTLETGVTGFHVGSYRNADGRWFPGSIDEVAIWNRTLGSADAVQLYYRGLTNQAITSTPTTVLATNLLAYYNFEETGSTGLSNKAPGTSSYNATRGQWTGSNPDWASGANPSGPGFAGNPTFDGGDGTSNRGTLLSGNALNLIDARNEFLNLPLGTAELGQTFTISAWHALTPGASNNSNRYHVFECNDNYDVSWGTNSVTTNTGPYSTYNYLGYIASGSSVGPTGVATGPWHHVVHVITSDGTTTTLAVYFDGVFVGSRTGATSAMSFTSLNFGRARAGTDSPTDRDWDGMLDEIGLWNRALSPDEITDLYQRGSTGKAITSGVVATDDSRTKPADNSPVAIAVAELLANDLRWGSNGNPTTEGLAITSVTAGPGNAVTLGTGPDAGWIFLTPSAASPETFTYTAGDGTYSATATVTLTAEASAPTFPMQFTSRGTATYDSGSDTTSISHDFTGVPGQTWQIEWSTDLLNWTLIPNVATGPTGSFTVNVSQAGNHAATWNSSMFFRARR